MKTIKVDIKEIKATCWLEYLDSLGLDINAFTEAEENFMGGNVIQRFQTDRWKCNEFTVNLIQEVLKKNREKATKRTQVKFISNMQSSFDFISYSPVIDDTLENNILQIECAD